MQSSCTSGEISPPEALEGKTITVAEGPPETKRVRAGYLNPPRPNAQQRYATNTKPGTAATTTTAFTDMPAANVAPLRMEQTPAAKLTPDDDARARALPTLTKMRVGVTDREMIAPGASATTPRGAGDAADKTSRHRRTINPDVRPGWVGG